MRGILASRWRIDLLKEKIYTTLIKEKSCDLWISDEPEFIRECVKQRIPVIEYTHADLKDEDFHDSHPDISEVFLTPWATDSVEAVKNDPEYMEKVIHRFAGIPMTVAETDDLIIRELCEADAESVGQIFSNGAASGYIGIWSDDVSDKKKALKEYCSLHYDLYGFGYYGVEMKGDVVLAGIVGFREYRENIVEDDHLKYVIKGRCPEETPLELGYVMGKKYRRKGYCVSACCELIKKIPGDVYILVDRNNLPGIRTAEKISGQTDIFASDSSA